MPIAPYTEFSSKNIYCTVLCAKHLKPAARCDLPSDVDVAGEQVFASGRVGDVLEELRDLARGQPNRLLPNVRRGRVQVAQLDRASPRCGDCTLLVLVHFVASH